MFSARDTFRKFQNTSVFKVKNMISFDSTIQNIIECKVALCVIFIQCVFVLIFLVCVEYTTQADASDTRNSVGPVFGGFCQDMNMPCMQFGSKFNC